MNKLKRRSMLIAVVAIIFVFMTQPTVAYYTTIGTATNVVTSGGIELTIHEHTADGSKFPEQGVYIIPGDIVSKVVTIENTCGHPFYLRAKLERPANLTQVIGDYGLARFNVAPRIESEYLFARTRHHIMLYRR